MINTNLKRSVPQKETSSFVSFFYRKKAAWTKIDMPALFIAWFPFSDMRYNAQQHTVAHPQLVSVGDIIAQQRLCVEGEPPFSAATPTWSENR